jgi:hypothetical protein
MGKHDMNPRPGRISKPRNQGPKAPKPSIKSTKNTKSSGSRNPKDRMHGTDEASGR